MLFSLIALQELRGDAYVLTRDVCIYTSFFFFFLVYSHINILHASLENFLVRFSCS